MTELERAVRGKHDRPLPTNERLSTFVGAGKLGEIADDHLSGEHLNALVRLGGLLPPRWHLPG